MPKRKRGRRINGKLKLYSHCVWFDNTGHWPVKGEVIHHIDDDITNDSFSNLQLMTDSEHKTLHRKGVSLSEKHRANLSAAWTPERKAEHSAFMLGRYIGENSPSWKGDNAKLDSKRRRIDRLKAQEAQ